MTSRLWTRSAAAALRARRWFLLTLMALLLSHRAAAQTAAASMALPLSCAEGATSPDTARLILTMLTRVDDTAHAIIADLQTQAIADNYRPPANLSFTRWPLAWDPKEVETGLGGPSPLPGFEGELAIRLGQDGHLREAAMTEPMDIPEVNQSLVAAAWRTDSVGGYERFGSTDSTLVVRIRVAASAHPTSRERPLVRLFVPFLRITTPLKPRSQPMPAFPKGAREDGFVTFAFVIAENGRVDSASLRLIDAKQGIFIPPARETILRSEFVPARSGACPVPVLAQQRVSFRAPKEPWPPPDRAAAPARAPWPSNSPNPQR